MKRRNTPTKEAVINVLSKTRKAMSQSAIEQEINLKINRATIYRVLNRFCEDGVLHRIVAEDGKQYFALCINCEDRKLPDNHFHFRCTSCETIECLEEPVHFSIPKHYSVETINCVLTGVCATCASIS
ncbi:Fur family transcriptional regulator [Kordia sp.]|uniref:Fur family transcriptional regulator n=1 Tax=Kordia sp. TaxID=1965332 RepID=UPI003B595ACE